MLLPSREVKVWIIQLLIDVEYDVCGSVILLQTKRDIVSKINTEDYRLKDQNLRIEKN